MLSQNTETSQSLTFSTSSPCRYRYLCPLQPARTTHACHDSCAIGRASLTISIWWDRTSQTPSPVELRNLLVESYSPCTGSARFKSRDGVQRFCDDSIGR